MPLFIYFRDPHSRLTCATAIRDPISQPTFATHIRDSLSRLLSRDSRSRLTRDSHSRLAFATTLATLVRDSRSRPQPQLAIFCRDFRRAAPPLTDGLC